MPAPDREPLDFQSESACGSESEDDRARRRARITVERPASRHAECRKCAELRSAISTQARDLRREALSQPTARTSGAHGDGVALDLARTRTASQMICWGSGAQASASSTFVRHGSRTDPADSVERRATPGSRRCDVARHDALSEALAPRTMASCSENDAHAPAPAAEARRTRRRPHDLESRPLSRRRSRGIAMTHVRRPPGRGASRPESPQRSHEGRPLPRARAVPAADPRPRRRMSTRTPLATPATPHPATLPSRPPRTRRRRATRPPSASPTGSTRRRRSARCDGERNEDRDQGALEPT